MKKIGLYLSFLCCFSWSVNGQIKTSSKDSVEVLETATITNRLLRDFSVGQTLHHLSDSVLVHNAPSLTSLLEYNTPIYFKQNGLGMVSSASFRGTTASQTAVLWNGININSNFTGQTDFNTLNTGIYDNIDVRAGGGSIVYGSGAIGGTVHLNTELTFKKEFDNQLYVGYGSYNTLNTHYRLRTSSNKVSFRLAVERNQSDNDYDFQLRDGKNTNGQFHNTAINTAIGVKLNATNQLNFYGEFYNSNRHFPVYYLTENHTQYKDQNKRSLLEWKSVWGAFNSSLKAAFLSEHYKYYLDLNTPEKHDFGKAETIMGKYDLSYKLNQDILLDAVLSYQHTKGKGTNINDDNRNIASAGLLFKQQLSPRFRYQIGVRKEFTHTYESPLLYAVGVDYKVAPFYTVKISASKNFRRPTFNDLYWTNSGNTSLKAEQSNQIELGNTFAYNDLKLTVTGYFNDIKDMIHWLPRSGGLFSPRNEDHVQTYGVEALLQYKKQFNGQTFTVNGTYAYTYSRNKKTHNQLIYVPYNKATFSAAYSLHRFTINYQLLYNGSVYLRSDNDPAHILGGYAVSNVGLSYRLGKKNTYEIGGKVRNLFNKVYQNVIRYEMPGINFNFYIILNF